MPPRTKSAHLSDAAAWLLLLGSAVWDRDTHALARVGCLEEKQDMLSPRPNHPPAMNQIPNVQRHTADLRTRMVERHILPVVRDPGVLAAMATVPRHLFVPPRLRDAAYDDRRLFVGWGQFLSQPRMIARMLALAGLRDHDRVLEIGAGSGYEAALLSHIVREVHTIEIVEALARQAAMRLACLGAANATVIAADGGLGHAAGAPYDAILVTAAAPHVPRALLEQLADGGRLVIPVGDPDLQQLERVTRHGERFETEHLEYCRFSPLLGDAARQP